MRLLGRPIATFVTEDLAAVGKKFLSDCYRADIQMLMGSPSFFFFKLKQLLWSSVVFNRVQHFLAAFLKMFYLFIYLLTYLFSAPIKVIAPGKPVNATISFFFFKYGIPKLTYFCRD